MPPHKAPSKLYVCARKKVNDMLDVTCANIWELHWTYNQNSIVQVISNVQNFLTTTIPVSVLDDVINIRKAGKFIRQLCSNGDIKIMLSLVMHPQMRIFKIYYLEIPTNLTTKIEESFWISHLRKMSNLVFLSLPSLCTDEILKTIGQYCTQLEEVNVISKMSQIPERGNFNALRKVYHVSDLGLSYLTQCQKLKFVTVNRSTRSGFGNITEKGISMLICNLPNLISINYEFMGAVLAHIPLTSSPLRLQFLKDLRVNPESITLYNTLCPSLISLHISLPTNLGPEDIIPQSEAVIAALSNSSLKIKKLDQTFIYISDNTVLETFLAKKGANLVRIYFGIGCSDFDLERLTLIGQYCPNIEEISIGGMIPDAMTFPRKRSLMFQKLKILRLHGESTWNVTKVLLLCLQGSKICEIFLAGGDEILDDTFTKLIQGKTLLELKDLLLHRQCCISSSTVWKILRECPQLKYFACLFHHTFTAEERESFKNFIRDNNYDLDLTIRNND